MKAEIEAKLGGRHKKELDMDVVIRDVKRMNKYADIKSTKKGISSWCKSGLMGTYHRGILLGLRWEMLTADGEENWRYTNHKAGKAGHIKVILIGYVPYENVEPINWEGDEYYGEPHITATSTQTGGGNHMRSSPFARSGNSIGIPFYTEVCPYEQVRKCSRKLGIR